MPSQTIFVVEVFEEQGERLAPSSPVYCGSTEEAVRRARLIESYTGLGVVAWRRTGDLEAGTWDGPAVRLYSGGRIPPEA
jgi:hypothetical protein